MQHAGAEMSAGLLYFICFHIPSASYATCFIVLHKYFLTGVLNFHYASVKLINRCMTDPLAPSIKFRGENLLRATINSK